MVEDKAAEEGEEVGEVAPGDPSANIDSTRAIDPAGDQPTDRPTLSLSAT